MQAISDYKYLGLLSFIILLIGLVFVIYKWPAERHLTFSQRVALQKQSIIYYVGLFTIVLPLFILFIVGWFVPYFHLSGLFSVFIIAGSLLQYTTTLIPEVGGWKTKIHRYLYGVSAICLLPPLVHLLFATSLTIVDKIIVSIGLGAMFYMIIFANISKKERYEVSYIHQAIYYIGFFLPILAISYL